MVGERQRRRHRGRAERGSLEDRSAGSDDVTVKVIRVESWHVPSRRTEGACWEGFHSK